jgi:hypothetical protein
LPRSHVERSSQATYLPRSLVVGECEASDLSIGQKRWHVRFGIVGVAALAALVVAGRSLGAIAPHLVVTSGVGSGGAQTLSISVSKQKGDDPVGQIRLFVPAGFALSSPPVGARLGTITARVVAGALNPATEQFMSGSVVAISPTDPAVAYEGTTCDTSQHLAAWMARLGAGTTSFDFPIFVDAASDTGASFGPYVLVACFRPSDLPATDPNRSPGGSSIDSFTLTLTPFTAPTSAGAYLWRSLWTPFAAGTGSLDPSGSVEAQSTDQVLMSGITIDAAKTSVKLRGAPLTLLIVSGRVLLDNQPQAGVLVRVRHGAAPTRLVALGRVGTGSDGVYLIVTVIKAAQYLQASADLPVTDLGPSGCQPSFGVPCLDATTGAGHVVSANMLVQR